MAGDVETIAVTYKDRFGCAGYDWFERQSQKADTQIVVLNNPDLLPEEELTEDLIVISYVLLCRLYGLRKYKKKLEDDPSLK